MKSGMEWNVWFNIYKVHLIFGQICPTQPPYQIHQAERTVKHAKQWIKPCHYMLIMYQVHKKHTKSIHVGSITPDIHESV
jgi:hypothetical protein